MNTRIRGHIISHTHWDREWREPLAASNRNLKIMLDEVLDTLSSDPAYRAFLFDGQVIGIDDYLRLAPHREPELREAVAKGRLHIGPWYNLPDLYPVCGEALVRNLLWGTRRAEALGGCLRIGYTTFGWGQTAQLPQLLAGFGIDFVVVAKHVSSRRAPHCEFVWEGADGTRLLASRLGIGKRNNFYFHMYLPVAYGRNYRDAAWGYDVEQDAFLLHPARPEQAQVEHLLLPRRKLNLEWVERCLSDLLDTTKETLVPTDLFFGDGTDYSGVTPGLHDLITQLNQCSGDIEFIHSTLPDYVAALKSKLTMDDLPVVQGELRDGPIASVSGNALAVRTKLKTLNRKAQSTLINQAEPFANLAPTRDAKLLEHLLAQAWGNLLQAHSHDAINGVTTDQTVADVEHRLQQVVQLGDTTFQAIAEDILSRLDLPETTDAPLYLTLFNPLPIKTSEVVTALVDIPQSWNWKWVAVKTLDGDSCPVQSLKVEEKTTPVNVRNSRALPWKVDRHQLAFFAAGLPAMGWKTFRLHPDGTKDRVAQFWRTDAEFGSQRKGPLRMTNKWLDVTINGDGSLNVLHLSTGQHYGPLNYYEYSGDSGDFWQRVVPENQTECTTLGRTADIRVVKDGPLLTRFSIRQELRVPAHADRARNLMASHDVTVTFETHVTLKHNTPWLEISTTLHNQASDCRLRAGFATGIATDEVYSEGHFCVDRRPLAPPINGSGRRDAHMSTQPLQRWVDVSNRDHGLAVLNRNLFEYEMLGDGDRHLMLTLQRCTAMRICSEYRAPQEDPGQTGAQAHGHSEFHYALFPHAGQWEEGGVYEAANTFNLTCRPYQHNRPREGTLPPEHSMLSITPPLQLSAVKRTEEGSALIVRVYNPSKHTTEGRITLDRPIKQVQPVALDESPLPDNTQPFTITQNHLTFTAQHNRIISLLIHA